MQPILYVVIPCYNEEKVLPETCPEFMAVLKRLIAKEKISEKSRLLYVDDGSSDHTWDIISSMHVQSEYVQGISLSRNRGHQNALLAGLMEARQYCDISISADCDGQDDVNAMESMIDEYLNGNDVVYGVRSDRASDTFLKRNTAQFYYHFLSLMGVESVYNHADYRLLSKRVLDELAGFHEVNLYLRGMVPLIGFSCTCVPYERHERAAGNSHYSIRKMLTLAMDGITSFTIRPIRLITGFGLIIAFLSFIGMIWSVFIKLSGQSVQGWSSLICIICFLSGVQLFSLGMIGEYIGKIYLETKARPRYIISQKTDGLAAIQAIGKSADTDKTNFK